MYISKSWSLDSGHYVTKETSLGGVKDSCLLPLYKQRKVISLSLIYSVSGYLCRDISHWLLLGHLGIRPREREQKKKSVFDPEHHIYSLRVKLTKININTPQEHGPKVWASTLVMKGEVLSKEMEVTESNLMTYKKGQGFPWWCRE